MWLRGTTCLTKTRVSDAFFNSIACLKRRNGITSDMISVHKDFSIWILPCATSWFQWPRYETSLRVPGPLKWKVSFCLALALPFKDKRKSMTTLWQWAFISHSHTALNFSSLQFLLVLFLSHFVQRSYRNTKRHIYVRSAPPYTKGHLVATPLLTESPVANLREILWNLETKKHLGICEHLWNSDPSISRFRSEAPNVLRASLRALKE